MNKKKNEKNIPLGTDVALIAEREEIQSRKFKYSTIAAVFSAVFIVAVIAANVLIGYLTDRFVFEIDLTREKLFEISDVTLDVIADLEEPVTITVLSEETSFQNGSTLLGNIYEIFQRYIALGAGKITLRFLNPLANVGETDRYKQMLGTDLSENDIIVESSKRVKRLTPDGMYTRASQNLNGAETSYSGSTEYYVGLRAEQRISSAILFVTGDDVAKAAWIYGHDENYSISEFDTLLNYSNFDVITLRLLQEPIPDDVALLIISAPAADYNKDEIAKIDEFLLRGGDMIVAMGPQTLNHPNLDALFAEWGVSYGTEIIYDAEQCVSIPHNVVPDIAVFQPITENLPRQYAIMPAGRPINLTSTQGGQIGLQTLMSSSATSYAKAYEDAMGDFAQNPQDAVGPLNMMVLAERMTTDKANVPIRSDILFTNAGFVTESALTENAFLNRVYLGAAINYMADYTDGLVIPDKDFQSSVLSILGWQSRTVLIVLVLILPLVIIALGIIIRLRRRHL
ncbi:MAG: GldG family protein [Oscillospiraceae bacterium]|jgi:hypothetical protein|nr:GldG family protein [Oscillospiraceae bacterium]